MMSKVKPMYKKRVVYFVEYDDDNRWMGMNAFFTVKECRKFIKQITKGDSTFNPYHFRIIREYKTKV